jgi:VanZ family protein|tara:strand:+ start:1188 stop:1619 length:432 start_codon:yes stop_codon:yes gene_type:complete
MIWKLTFFFVLVTITLAGFWPAPTSYIELGFWQATIPYTELSVWSTPVSYIDQPLDKFAHALGFFALAFSLYRAKYSSLWVSTLLLLAWGALIELGQEWFLPQRTCSLADLCANGVGVAIGLTLELNWHFIRRRKTICTASFT